MSKALAKERKQRYQTAQAFADDLRCVVNGLPISIAPATMSAKVRRWATRKETIRQAGWAGVIGYSALSLFFLVYICAGLLAWSRWLPILPRDIRYTEFMLNLIAWMAGLVLLAWVNWRVTRAHVPSIWVAFVSGLVLSVYTASVLFGFSSYDFGGALRDPVLRVALYLLYTPLAFLAAFVSLLALITAYRLRQWDRPVIDQSRRHDAD